MSVSARVKSVVFILLGLLLVSIPPLPAQPAQQAIKALPVGPSVQLAHAAPEMATLFSDNFENGISRPWNVTSGWSIAEEGSNDVLDGFKGSSPSLWATLHTGKNWTDYTFSTKVKMINGSVQLMVRLSDLRGRYIIGIHPGGMYLRREYPWEKISTDLVTSSVPFSYGIWYTISIEAYLSNLRVSVNGVQRLNYKDSWGNALWEGTIGLEVNGGSSAEARFDDVSVYGVVPPSGEWIKTGGPIGGLGYDVRYGSSTSVLYVTDNYSGVNKSQNGGLTWFSANRGISRRFGTSGDAIPVFTLTVDLNNPDILWAGLKDQKGAFKSTNAGQLWSDVTPTISEAQFIFRGFTVQPGNSNIVYAQGEIPMGVSGVEFDKVRGRIYRTADGGATWSTIWEGDNLVRYVIIHPQNPNRLFASLGIFDREANDSNCATIPPTQGTGGVLKLEKQGSGWDVWYLDSSHGLTDHNVGSLVMHPTDPDIMLAGAGNNACSTYTSGGISYNSGGVFRTQDGGETWVKTLSNVIITSVEFSPSDPQIAYAGGQERIYRSLDGGITWSMVAGQSFSWGPPGVLAGFPIDILVHPSFSDQLFINNYGGGNVMSVDGGSSWQLASNGYTGALLLGVAVHPTNPGVVYAAGRSGLFRSFNGGTDWIGLSKSPAGFDTAYDVAVKPDEPNVVIASHELMGGVYRSQDYGITWTQVYTVPGTLPGVYTAQHGFKVIEFARPSNSNYVYAGACRGSVGLMSGATASKGVFKSTNGGLTWASASDTNVNTKCIHDLAIHPTNPNIVYAASPAGGLFRTYNGGTTWTRLALPLANPYPDVRAVAVHPTYPDIIYVGTYSYGIFISSNGGNGFDPLVAGMEPNDAIMKILFDPTDPDIIWAASFNSGIYRWVSSESRWTHVNSGLSTRAVVDLAISSDGKYLYASTQGEGVFRFGVLDFKYIYMPLISR